MNIEDAIRIIKGLDTSNSEENIEAKKMAVKALEKQRKRRLKNGTDKHRAHAANFAGRLLIGVMNSEKKYRHTLESSRDPAESKRTLCCHGRASA